MLNDSVLHKAACVHEIEMSATVHVLMPVSAIARCLARNQQDQGTDVIPSG